MAERTAVVAGAAGLHARPAAEFVRAAGGSTGSAVTIRRPGGDPVPAASILAVLTLGVGQGETVVLEADGEGADAVLDALARLLAEDSPP